MHQVYHLKCLNEKTGERWTLGKRYTDWANLARALHDKSPESSAHSTFPPYQLFNPLSPASVQFRLEQLRVFLGELQADESVRSRGRSGCTSPTFHAVFLCFTCSYRKVQLGPRFWRLATWTRRGERCAAKPRCRCGPCGQDCLVCGSLALVFFT